MKLAWRRAGMLAEMAGYARGFTKAWHRGFCRGVAGSEPAAPSTVDVLGAQCSLAFMV